MHAHVETQTSIAADIVDRIVTLDALLGHCDEQDLAELQERLAQIDRGEFKNIISIFGAKPTAADIVDRIVTLDALLGHCDEQDLAELQERLAQIDRGEFKNIISIFGAKPTAAATVEGAVKE